MDLNGKTKETEELARRLGDLRDRVLPVKAGALAESHFKENFRRGGYRDGSFTPWPVTRRQQLGKGAASQYGPLLSGRNHLMNSIRYIPGQGRVTILNDVVYAPVHNEGGVVSHTITPKMRKFAWAHYFEATGITKGDSKEAKKSKAATAGDQARMWKGLALTKKAAIRQTIPQRRFMGKGKEITEKVTAMAERELRNIIRS